MGTLGKDHQHGDRHGGPGNRVLVAEEDVEDAKTALEAVEAMGSPTEVEVTPSGSRALYLLEQDRFDCLVLEFDLADLDGLEVVRRLRETDEKTPVIVWTNRDAPPLEAKLLEAGADAYLTKNGRDDERVKETLERHAEQFTP